MSSDYRVELNMTELEIIAERILRATIMTSHLTSSFVLGSLPFIQKEIGLALIRSLALETRNCIMLSALILCNPCSLLCLQ